MRQIMWQQMLALVIIFFFGLKLWREKKKGTIGGNEFIFWITFWILAAAAIIFIKELDLLAAKLGFSGSGINILLYLAVIFLFSMIFKLRLRVEKTERNLTKLARRETLEEAEKEK